MNIYPKYFLDKGEELDKDVFFDVILFKTVNIYFIEKMQNKILFHYSEFI